MGLTLLDGLGVRGRELWYPTQAKVRLEWGTQHLFEGKAHRRSLGFARDDKFGGGGFL
jgi:hypothetical protein